MVRLDQASLLVGSHSERMMGDMMKILANLTMQNQQLLQQHLQLQQQTAGAADNHGLLQKIAAGDGGHVQESSGARNERVIDSSGPLVRKTSVKLVSLSGE